MRTLLIIIFILIYYTAFGQNKKVETGIASYYGKKFHGKKTASGETFDMHKFTAAHPSLPFNTQVKVTNVLNQRSVIVRINDRGPYTGKRVIDLSKAAAEKLGFVTKGRATVRIEILEKKEKKKKQEKSYKFEDRKDPLLDKIEKLSPGKTYSVKGTAVRMRGFGICVRENVPKTEAVKQINKISALGNYRIYLYLKESAGANFYTVVLGNFEDPERASDFQYELKNKGINGYIRQY